MKVKTKSWILNEYNKFELSEIEFESYGQLVINVLLSSICGTDLHIIEKKDHLSRPLSLGHEFIGEVISHNDQYHIGDRVIVAPGVPCGECYYCKEYGVGNWCTNRKSHGIYGLNSSQPILGGFTTQIALADGIKTYKIPPKMSNEIAVLTEPLTVAIRALDRAIHSLRSHKDKDIAIVGLGPIGTLTAILAKIHGYNVVGIDKEPYRVNYVAREFGISSYCLRNNNIESKFDVVIECTGYPDALCTCFQLLRRGGRLVIAGHFYSNGKVGIDPCDICRNDWEIYGTVLGDEFSYMTAINLLCTPVVPWNKVISNFYDFSDTPAAFEMASKRSCMKVTINVCAN